MNPARTRRDERREETRTDLVAAATRVFAERGFHGASVDAIAREAGFTTGAVYAHFKGKDDLFLAAFEQYALTRVDELTELHASATGTLGEKARAFADHWMARLAADPDFMLVSLEFFLHSLRKPELRAALADRQAAVRLAVGRMLEEDLRASGTTLPLPAQDVATVMRELGIGLALAKLLDPDAIRDSLYGDFVQTFYDLGARP